MSERSINDRTTLFISHALPEDAEFVAWLAIKLRNEGFDVWCELEQIHGGEHFWREIQKVLEQRAIKMLLVASKVSVIKDGVRNEWDFARELQKQHMLRDFIIPLNLDGVSSNSIIGLTSLAMINFQNSWAHGLSALIKKLNKDGVPKIAVNSPLSIRNWYNSKHAVVSGLLDRKEYFYSNWLELPSLPDQLFIHEYNNEAQATLCHNHFQGRFPIFRHERYLITMERSLAPILRGESNPLFDSSIVKPVRFHQLPVNDVISDQYRSTAFPITRDASNLLIRFINQALHKFFIDRGLQVHELANKRLCYFYVQEDGVDKKVKYISKNKTRQKQLSGTFEHKHVWHYGLSFVVKTAPFPHLSFKSHIIFSDNGVKIWDKKEMLQSARRRKGKRMFNAEWRDLLLAFFGSLSDDQAVFNVPLSNDESIWLSCTPLVFESDRGYNEPSDEGRLISENLEDEDFEEDEFMYSSTENTLDYDDIEIDTTQPATLGELNS